MADKLKKYEGKKIPDPFDYENIPGLSREVVEKLLDVRPETIGQASRMPTTLAIETPPSSLLSKCYFSNASHITFLDFRQP